MKLAAIDVGSNAIRLLLSRVTEPGTPPTLKKESLVRMPLRLGADAFVKNRISDDNVKRLVSTMQGFHFLMDAYQPLSYRACATSAMREAENGMEVAAMVKDASGIELEIVGGKREAEIIYSNHFEENLKPSKSYLYIDVGGGSTELTLFSKNRSITSRSFDIGTVRLLHDLVPEDRWKQMRKWLKAVSSEMGTMEGIGSGGNINKIFRMSRTKDGKPLSRQKIEKIYDYLKTFSLAERIKILGLRPDRADVIIPASEIFLSVMEWTGIKRIYVPQIGLADGLVRLLYEEHSQSGR
jgi:exopolyphosphatase/guanosine-5'-triphosphate,3'-diphosphate pyrophosphatase